MLKHEAGLHGKLRRSCGCGSMDRTPGIIKTGERMQTWSIFFFFLVIMS